MSDNKEKIQQLEREAKELVQNLEVLYQEGINYSKAKEDLQITNTSLIEFIKTSKDLAIKSNNIITRINEIGAANILDRIKEIEDKQFKLNKQISEANKVQVKETKINRMLNVIGIVIIIIIQTFIIFKITLN